MGTGDFGTKSKFKRIEKQNKLCLCQNSPSPLAHVLNKLQSIERRKILKKYIIGILIILLVVGGILAYSMLKDKNSGNTEMTKIRLNEVTRSVFYAPQYVAISNGYFKEENLDIEITTGQGADKVMTAVLAGQSDIGFARTGSCNLCI